MDSLPVGATHALLLILCTLGLAADIAEVALGNALAAVFAGAPGHELSLLLASVFAGGAVGAPVFGWLADRHGRRRMIQLALVMMAGGSLAAALSPSPGWLILSRFVTGLALGGFPPLTGAYLADCLPPGRRGVLMMLCGALAFLGAPGMILLIRALHAAAPLGIEGWRWGLLAGSAWALATAAAFMRVPESPRWLAARQQGAAALQAARRFGGRVPMFAPVHETGVLAARDARAEEPGPWLLLAGLQALAPWAAIGFPLLSGAVLVHKGFSLDQSLLFAGLTMFGPSLGILAAAPLIDRFQRRSVLVVCALLMVVLGLAFAASDSLPVLLATGLCFNLVSAISSAALALYGAELFPTTRRAGATAAAFAVGRAVSVAVPLVLLPLLRESGATAMAGAVSLALLVFVAALLLAGPSGRAGQPVVS